MAAETDKVRGQSPIKPEPGVSRKSEIEANDVDREVPDRSQLPPYTTSQTARLMGDDASDQRPQSSNDQDRQQESAADNVGSEPIPGAPIPRTEQAAQNSTASAAKKNGATKSKAIPRPSGFRRSIIRLVALLIIVAATFGTMPWWYGWMPAMVQNIVPESLRPPSGAVSETAVESIAYRLSRAEREIAALRQSITAASLMMATTPFLPQAETNTQTATTLTALQHRLTALETGTVQTATSVGSNGIDTADALRLAARITLVEATANTFVNEQTGAIGLLLAASQLREAVATGRPFRIELEALLAFAAKQPQLTIDITDLATHQRSGVPTRVKLQNQFHGIAPSVVRAGLLPTDSASWFQNTLDRILSVVTVRRLDDDGSASVGAIVTRIEDRLSDGDIEAAIIAAEDLKGLAAKTLAPWLSNARIITTAERSVTAVVSQAIGQMNIGQDIALVPSEARE